MPASDIHINVREAILSNAEGSAEDQVEAVCAVVGFWIRVNGGYFGMDEDSTNAMALAASTGQEG